MKADLLNQRMNICIYIYPILKSISHIHIYILQRKLKDVVLHHSYRTKATNGDLLSNEGNERTASFDSSRLGLFLLFMQEPNEI